MLLDNFGRMLAGIMRPPSGSVSVVKTVFKDDTNTDRSFDMYSTGAGFFREGVSKVQVGKGTTAPTKQDFAIETAFLNAPENTFVNSATWGLTAYPKTQGQTTIVNVQENDTVEEVVLARNCRDTTNVLRTIVLMRDLVTPAPFLIGENIILEHTLEVS